MYSLPPLPSLPLPFPPSPIPLPPPPSSPLSLPPPPPSPSPSLSPPLPSEEIPPEDPEGGSPSDDEEDDGEFVCGTNGETYRSLCELIQDTGGGENAAYGGRCDDDECGGGPVSCTMIIIIRVQILQCTVNTTVANTVYKCTTEIMCYI